MSFIWYEKDETGLKGIRVEAETVLAVDSNKHLPSLLKIILTDLRPVLEYLFGIRDIYQHWFIFWLVSLKPYEERLHLAF